MSSGPRIYHVDSFARAPFAGNPAAVLLLDSPATASWMQAMASELNLSETAFVVREGARFRLRWFTPAVEVPLCGHATLATAFALTQAGDASGPIEFETLSGRLVARPLDDGAFELDFPADAPAAADAPAGMLEALGCGTPRAMLKSRFAYVVELADEGAVRAVRPDFSRLRENVIVTARGDAHDFVSRFFAPPLGIAEDPVTGAAHCVLGPLWSARLGKPELRAFQASARGGELGVRLAGERVFLSGHATLVYEGRISPNLSA